MASDTNPGLRETVAILGAGVMGETLLAGVLRAGWTPERVLIAERRPDRAAELHERYGVRVVDNVEAARQGETLLVVVKPQDIDAVLTEVRDVLDPGTLVVSVAAGVSTQRVENQLPPGTPVVRVMPNTPALVNQGMAAISPGSHCTDGHLARTRALLEATGRVVEVPEYSQDAVTAVSGSGPAYVFYLAEALIEAGILVGLPRPTATELAVQTLYGAATMLRERGDHPGLAREQVSSPAGTTIAALRVLDQRAVKAAVMDAVEAARDRSKQLARGDG
ncbi:MAG: pyrroline-5-carboxylate reductase [Actinomycetales bacterium]